ncbi:MAG: N-acetylmuramoyl-L-alanine amidase [Deltaproteobacteria bacterium]|nr:N-acetylmuramoyl-L-alanine amidase [Deltaproteobacteria bacterium]
MGWLKSAVNMMPAKVRSSIAHTVKYRLIQAKESSRCSARTAVLLYFIPVMTLLLLCRVAVADSLQREFDAVQGRLMSLRNTDVNVSRRSEWDRISQQLNDFARRYPQSTLAARALFNSGVADQQIYNRYREANMAQAACFKFRAVTQRHPSSPLADDALVKCAEVRAAEGNKEEAEILYRKVLELYPDGDMVPIASMKINADSGALRTIKRPGSDTLDNKDARRTGRPVVVIDPGHGGEDMGAVGVGGLLEKDVVLQISLELQRILEDDLNAVVRLTRTGDRFVPLLERTAFANDFEADIFVSLHCNASPKKVLHGLEVYYLDNTGDRASKALAERENASVQYEGAQADLQYMLSDLIQNLKLDDSISLANHLRKATLARLSKANYKVRDLGVKKAPFYVLVGAHMPCVLVEISFIDHQREGKLLGTPEYRAAVAQGIASGIKSFLSQKK